MYKSPKNPIFVQLSPIKCTYSNIFIRFFKFFPANTNIYQNSYSVIRRAVRLTPGCPVITMRLPYLIRYEVFNVITMRCPFRAIRHKLRFWPNNRRKRQLFVFCLFIPFPHGYTVSRGVPVFSLAMTKYFVPKGNEWRVLQRRIKYSFGLFYVILRSCIATTWESPGREPCHKPKNLIVFLWRILGF